MNDFNRAIIEEFRANGGTVGGPFEGSTLLLLRTIGAKSGAERVHPLAYRRDGESFVVFGSAAGADQHPAWFRNLVANPRVTVEVGTETFDAVARVADGDEHERLWSAQKRDVPAFAEYEAKTSRRIPVVLLERAA